MKNENEIQIFVTDYASYNAGEQFKAGHWVDLTQFSSTDELSDYLKTHFENAGINDPEIMITDFEGFPRKFYSESYDSELMEKVFKYIDFDFDNLSDSEKISLWNEYCSENSIDNEIHSFDEDFFETFFSGKPMEAARAATFGTLNWSDNYIQFNGYGNLESFNDPSGVINEDELIDWMIDNK